VSMPANAWLAASPYISICIAGSGSGVLSTTYSLTLSHEFNALVGTLFNRQNRPENSHQPPVLHLTGCLFWGVKIPNLKRGLSSPQALMWTANIGTAVFSSKHSPSLSWNGATFSY
jgi:hypothetical protein